MKSLMLVTALVIATLGPASASEVDPPPPDHSQMRRYNPVPPPRGYLPPPPPRYYEPAPAPRARLGDICVIEDSRSGRSCDLRRPAPLGSFCECIGQSGRPREGRVSR